MVNSLLAARVLGNIHVANHVEQTCGTLCILHFYVLRSLFAAWSYVAGNLVATRGFGRTHSASHGDPTCRTCDTSQNWPSSSQQLADALTGLF